MFQRLFVIALATVLTRSIPFIFLKNKEIPEKFMIIIDALPYATISLLVVYCFKDLTMGNLMPNVLASSVCVGLYLWKNNSILSIASSTLIYMLLI